MLFYGYKINGQQITTVEMRLRDIQKAIIKKANKEYQKLLAAEIQNLVDHIALNEIARPTTESLFEVGNHILNQKVAYASGQNLPTEHNFETSVNVMFYEGDTYVKFNAANNIYKKELSELQDIEDFPCPPSGDNEKVWVEIMKKYTDWLPPLGIRLFNAFDPVKPEHLKFASPAKRAKATARHRLTNRYLSMYSGNQQIQNYMLMDYMDCALNALTSIPGSQAELQRMETELRSILPVITTDLITTVQNNTEEQVSADNKKGAQ